MIVYNTLTKRKEPFEPITAGTVRMFVCGPTVYDLSHLGHAKTYTQFDLIARYLRRRGYRVTYVQNITDIDDKIIGRAAQIGTDPVTVAAGLLALAVGAGLQVMAALMEADVTALVGPRAATMRRARRHVTAMSAGR